MGYYECAHTPGLWGHVTRPIKLTLVIDYFGVKYVGKEHIEHLRTALKKNLGSELPCNALPQDKLFSVVSVFTRKLPGKYGNFPPVTIFPPVIEPGLAVR